MYEKGKRFWNIRGTLPFFYSAFLLNYTKYSISYNKYTSKLRKIRKLTFLGNKTVFLVIKIRLLSD